MRVYLGTFLIAFATLALEITTSRLISVVSWYHMAFFAVSTAMLGMTAGASRVFLQPARFTPDRLDASVASACLSFGAVTVITLPVLCLVPLGIYPTVTNALALLIVTAACSLPFYFSGIAISAVLTKYAMPIGRLYSSDLIGAAMGCLFVLRGLEHFDAPSLILLTGMIGVVAAFCFSQGRTSPRFLALSALTFVGLGLLVWVNSTTISGIRPVVVKGQIEDPAKFAYEKWNSFSRVIVVPLGSGRPSLSGPSPVTPEFAAVKQNYLDIDGLAATIMSEFSSPKDVEYLRYDVTNIGYHLRPEGPACIIGVGGGRDVQSALLFGHEKVTGIDVNPIFIDLHKGPYREFAGIGGHPKVSLVIDEARSYLTRTTEKFSIIQMSLIDTFASTGAGAFSLSENALYTVEAWEVFLKRLTDNGVFTVSRWFDPANMSEAGRAISLAVATLLRTGATDPSRHIAMICTPNLATLVIRKQPLGDAEINALRKVSEEMKFNIAIFPGTTPTDDALAKIISAKSEEQLATAIEPMPLNYEPPTDEKPYFFNMLRLGSLSLVASKNEGIIAGNLVATLILLALIFCLLLLTVITIVFPLAMQRQSSISIHWSGALYFSLIGAGFMFLEIALIQRLSVFLGHPAYALGILLFTIICSTGFGSFLSDLLPLDRKPWIFVFPLVTALAIVAMRFGLSQLISQMITAPTSTKIAVSIAVLSPLGVLLGCFFPIGMRIFKSIGAAETPWYWALNGIFGVLCSALAVFISIYLSISTNFYIASACYMVVLICVARMAGNVKPNRQAELHNGKATPAASM